MNVIAPHPTHPHPTKPLRAFSENENLRGVQAKMLYVENFTGSPVTPPPEIRGSHFPSNKLSLGGQKGRVFGRYNLTRCLSVFNRSDRSKKPKKVFGI